MEVIVITSPTHRENEVQRIVHLFENGLQTLHLRKPKWKSSELETLIKDIPEMFHNRIIIHGHYKLALKYKLKGIHLHRKHRSNKWKNRWKRFLLKMRSPNLVITTTFNSLESLRENTQRFDYVFLGSVFNSHSYYSRDEEAGMNMLKSIVKKSPSVVYALGGVTPERIPMVEEAGFGGVGLSSAVWKNFDKNPEKVLSVIKAA